MKISKTIKNGQVSHHNSVRKALKSNPIIVLQDRGLIIKH